MPKLIFWLLIGGIVIHSGLALSQASNIAELISKIKTLPDNQEKVNACIDYAIHLEAENLDSALYYYGIAGDLSKKLNDYESMHRYARNYTAALNTKGDFDTSLEVNLWSLALAEEKGDSLNIAKSLVNTANVYNFKGLFEDAIQYYVKAAGYFERLHEEHFLNIIYQNLGVVFDVTGQFERSLDYASKSVPMSRRVGDSLTHANVLINMAGTLSSMNLYDSAIRLATDGLSIAERIKNRSVGLNAHLALADIFYSKKEYQKSNAYFQRSLAEAQKLHYDESVSTALQGLAMNSLATENYKDADRYIMQAFEISKRHGVFETLNQQYPLIADIKAHLGDHASAYKFLLEYVALNDSLNSASLKKTMHELERKYQVEKKEREMAEKQLELEENKASIQKKNLWLAASVVGIVMIFSLLLYGYRLYKKKQQFHEQYVKTLQKEQELAELKASLQGREQERSRIAAEMHDDLGTGVTSILFLAEGLRQSNEQSAETKKIVDTARNLMAQVNEIIWSMNSEYDTLEDLVAYIRNTMSEFLSTINLDYEFHVPEEIPSVKLSGIERRNIYLVVKEVINNIVKHANATRVDISFSFDGQLKIIIHDNGKGIDFSSQRRFSNGLKNMESRMRVVNGNFTIRNEGGTLAELTVPLSV